MTLDCESVDSILRALNQLEIAAGEGLPASAFLAVGAEELFGRRELRLVFVGRMADLLEEVLEVGVLREAGELRVLLRPTSRRRSKRLDLKVSKNSLALLWVNPTV